MLEVSFTGWGNCWYVRIPHVHVHKQNIIKFDDEVTGIFRLSPEDEKEYLRTKSFYHVKTMRPCLSPGSTFSKLVEEGKIPKIDAQYCYFEVKQYREVYAPIPRKNIEVEVLNVFKVIEPDNTDSAAAKQNETSRTDREYLLRTIGALSLLLVEKNGGNKLGTRTKPNKLALHREITQILSDMELSILGQGKSKLNEVLNEAFKITLDEDE
jgi:hypothetical protein